MSLQLTIWLLHHLLIYILCKAAEKLQMWRGDGKHSMLVLRIYTFLLSLIIVKQQGSYFTHLTSWIIVEEESWKGIVKVWFVGDKIPEIRTLSSGTDRVHRWIEKIYAYIRYTCATDVSLLFNIISSFVSL